MKKFFTFGIIISYFYLPQIVFAHEAYVLTRQQFQQGLQMTTRNPLAGLIDPTHIGLFFFISFFVALSYCLVIVFSTTPLAAFFDKVIKKANLIGPLIIRLAISASFFYAAQSNSILGPELGLSSLPGGMIIRVLLFAISIMVFFGVFVELAGFIGLIIFLYATNYYGWYMLTYLNYLGELIILFFFGSRFIALDRYLFGKKVWFKKLDQFRTLETPLIRMMYGLALLYAGWNIKFEHQNLSVAVYNQYHLKDFFHASAQFIAAGAGLSELLIGLFILIGFAMRWTILISLFFITISLLYFHELIWPHLMLYGISFSLLINSADFLTVDHYLIPWTKRVIKKIFTGK